MKQTDRLGVDFCCFLQADRSAVLYKIQPPSENQAEVPLQGSAQTAQRRGVGLIAMQVAKENI